MAVDVAFNRTINFEKRRNVTVSKKSLTAIGYGIASIVILMFITSLILSLLLKFTGLTESSLTWVIMTISFASIFLGGIISGGKHKEKGWLIGGSTGILFTLLVFLVQYLGYQTSFSLEQALYHVGYIITALCGGIIGVNMSGKRA